jgi:hypothetical protein
MNERTREDAPPLPRGDGRAVECPELDKALRAGGCVVDRRPDEDQDVDDEQEASDQVRSFPLGSLGMTTVICFASSSEMA